MKRGQGHKKGFDRLRCCSQRKEGIFAKLEKVILPLLCTILILWNLGASEGTLPS